MKQHRMYGLWASPVTPRSLAESLRLGDPRWDTSGDTLGWLEGRGNRGVIVVREGDGATRDLTPADISVRAQVGYGGGDFTLAHGAAYYVGQADQRIYRQELAGGLPRPITPAFGAASSPTVSPDGRWLLFVHTYENVDSIAIVDTEGKHWPARLAMGRDFYMQPAWHPDGDRIAWVEWSHPQMPWDGTEAKLGRLAFAKDALPTLAATEHIAGGTDIAVYQPEFAADGSALYYVSDESGFGQVYRRDLASGETRQLTTGNADFGEPAWAQGMRRYGLSPTGSVLAIRNERGFHSLVTVDRDGNTIEGGASHSGYTHLTSPAISPDGSRLGAVASAGAQPSRIVVIDLSSGSSEVVRRSDSEIVPPAALSSPEAVSWTSFDGEEAHGLFFPPTSEQFEADGPAPLIVMSHGGPTSQVHAAWNAQAQFFATRGYGVLLVNYRGSTGYGREYMLKLRESWGIYDVEDCRTGAEAMVKDGRADATKLVIMGGSAGGYTVLQSLVAIPGFYKAAICLYGISNQFDLAADTHKFESRYTDSLLGPLPEAAATYRERSPLFHADKIVDPVAIFQGDIDQVVPRAQSDAIVASLKARGVPHEYHVYEGEGHGWRKAETIEEFYKACEAFLRRFVLFA